VADTLAGAALAATPNEMTVEGHAHNCTCEHCWAQRTNTAAPPPDPLPTTRAELLAALDRAFNAGVKAERERAAREAAEARDRKS
jgi:hypothetical protein